MVPAISSGAEAVPGVASTSSPSEVSATHADGRMVNALVPTYRMRTSTTCGPAADGGTRASTTETAAVNEPSVTGWTSPTWMTVTSGDAGPRSDSLGRGSVGPGPDGPGDGARTVGV